MNRSAVQHLAMSAPLPYLLSVPNATVPVSGGRPILCFLHGYDEGSPTPIQQALTRHGPLRPTSSVVATAEFIIVAPQLPTRGDSWYRYADEVLTIVRQVQARHGGDPERTYLSGFSFGGNGVFDLALKQQSVWAALWAVDPTRVPKEDPARPVWLSSGEVSRRAKYAFIRHLHLKDLQTETLEDRVYEDQGEDHVGTATLAYRDERIYRWLLSKHLPSDRGKQEVRDS